MEKLVVEDKDKTTKKNAYIAFYLAPQLKDFLDEFSEKTDRSISSVLRMAVKEFKQRREGGNEQDQK